MSKQQFSSKQQILDYLDKFSPVEYERTRNYINGKVSHLSPYVTAGVISLSEIKDRILSKNSASQSFKLIQELAWRDFFASVRLSGKINILKDIKNAQFTKNDGFDEIPTAILEAKTGITALDQAITKLYETGYLHNHERMWIAFVVCNIARTNWIVGAKWMYYHLIDGDIASNMLSWQWVAGTFSSKKYIANQENINKYSNSKQFHTFLDKPYEQIQQGIDEGIIPQIFDKRSDWMDKINPHVIPSDRRFVSLSQAINNLNELQICTIETLTYGCNDLIWIDSELYQKIPFGQNRLDFVLSLGESKVFFGTETELQDLIGKKFETNCQLRMFPTITQYYPSFFGFWKVAQKLITNSRSH